MPQVSAIADATTNGNIHPEMEQEEQKRIGATLSPFCHAGAATKISADDVNYQSRQ